VSQSLLNSIVERIKHGFIRVKAHLDDITDIGNKAQHFGDIFSFRQIFPNVVHNLLKTQMQQLLLLLVQSHGVLPQQSQLVVFAGLDQVLHVLYHKRIVFFNQLLLEIGSCVLRRLKQLIQCHFSPHRLVNHCEDFFVFSHRNRKLHIVTFRAFDELLVEVFVNAQKRHYFQLILDGEYLGLVL